MLPLLTLASSMNNKCARRFNTETINKCWKERTFVEKLLFWKTFKILKYLEVPNTSPKYETASHEEVMLQGKYPFKIYHDLKNT